MEQKTPSEIKIKIFGSSDDEKYKFSDEKIFEYKSSNAFSIIETDKPVYKPGQKSKTTFPFKLTINKGL